MFDVLVCLFENYYQTETYPDQDTLERKLHAAGFENDDAEDDGELNAGVRKLLDAFKRVAKERAA